jgi:hypothetical protein
VHCAAAYAAPEAMVHLSDDLALLHRKYLLDCNVWPLFVSVEVLQWLTAEPRRSQFHLQKVVFILETAARFVSPPAGSTYRLVTVVNC